MKIIDGGITAPRGFWAWGTHCGIKYIKKDLALISSEVPCVASGVFTQNKVQAAPVKITKKHLKNNRAQAVIINSGSANCCTGRQGIEDTEKICQSTAKRLDIDIKDVLVASTGIIGQRLPVEKIRRAIKGLAGSLSIKGSPAAAEAIMTTDTKPKQIAVEVNIGRARVKIGAIAKGSGMIHPNMATMLAFIATDLEIDRDNLSRALKEAVDNSFNLITVEGDTSTNDMVLVLANGLAANARLKSDELKIFQKALNFVCLTLARMMIEDAEGATRFVEVCVENAQNNLQARNIAFKVANSALVKTAVFGKNPNWGRIAACVGAADSAVSEDRLTIYLDGIKVMQKGASLNVTQRKLKKIFRKPQSQIKINLGLGKCSAFVWTCDLSDKYVRINARY